MDYAVGESGARESHVADRSTRVAATVEAARGLCVSGDEARLWTTQPQRLDARQATFLQRLLERAREVWVARAAHDRLRSPRGADRVLYFTRRVRNLVARHPRQ